MIQHTMSYVLNKTFLFIFLSIFALSALSGTTASANISPISGLEGWAWSSTIGWISMSCKNTATCGASNYGVAIDAGNNLNGYAWSSNVGWIRFGGLSGFPNAIGNVAQNARIINQGTYTELEGWARACGGTASAPGACGAMSNNPFAGGWDGWISLQGTANDGSSYGVRFNDAAADTTYRWAWGSSVVGWIGFGGVTLADTPAVNSFTASPSTVVLGNPTTLTWDVQGLDSCQASNDNGQTDWDSTTAVSVASGSHSVQVNPPLGDTVYTLTCLDGATPYTESVTVTASTDIAINAFSLGALPSPNPDGTYDNVSFLASVSGIPNGENVNYRLLTTGATTQTISGVATQSGPTTTFSPPLQLSALNFGTHTYTLEVDLPAPGGVAEDISSTPQNEDIVGNSSSLSSQALPPIPPTMSLTASDDFVRIGEVATIDWMVSTPYVANCTVSGAGISTSFSTVANVNAVTTGPRDTDPMQATSVITLTCTEPITNSVYTEEVRVEVVPNVEEI